MYIFVRKVRLSGVSFSVTIVLIQNFFKMFKTSFDLSVVLRIAMRSINAVMSEKYLCLVYELSEKTVLYPVILSTFNYEFDRVFFEKRIDLASIKNKGLNTQFKSQASYIYELM